MNKLSIVKIIGGPLEPYLKDIEIIGRVQEDREQFYIFGCKKEDEKRFYEGILESDKIDNILGFNTVEEIEEFWLDGSGGMFLTVEKGDYKFMEQEERFLLDEDSICYGCQHYIGGEEGCNPSSICIEGSLNSFTNNN